MNRIIYYSLILLFSCSATLNAQDRIITEWSNVRIGGGGFVSGIIASSIEENLIYARTDVGGAYRWDNSQESWRPLLDWASEEEKALLGVESMAIDPQHPNRLYITAGLSGYGWPGASLLRSDDYGESFEKIPLDIYIHGNGMGRQNGEKLMVDPVNSSVLFMGTRKNGLMKSTDQGSHWTQISGFPVTSTPNLNGISFILPDVMSAESGLTQTWYAGVSQTGENLYVTHDGGDSWEVVAGAPVDQGIMPQRAVLSSDGSALYVTYANGTGPHAQTWEGVDEPMNKGAVFKYDVSEGTWLNISPMNLLVTPEASGCYGGITLDPQDDQHLVCSTINHWNQQQFYTDGSSAYGDRIFESHDGGETWQNRFATSPMKLNTNGVNWISGHNLHWVGCVLIDPFDSNRLFATSGNGIFSTSNLGASSPLMKFTVRGLEETVPLDMISIPDGPFVSIVGDYDGWLHEDINEFPQGDRLSPTMGTSTGVSYSPQNNNILVRAGSSGKVLYYSVDQGSSWTAFESIPVGLTNGKVAISSDNTTHRVVWVPDSDDKVYLTKDWGQSWTNIWNSSYGNIRGGHPVADPIDPTTFYIYVPSKGKLYALFYPDDGRPEVLDKAQVGTGGSPHIAVTPGKGADLWIAVGSGGLKHWSEGNTETVDNIRAEAVALGLKAPGSNYFTLYVWGSYNEVEGLYRSTDRGASWYRINDDEHEYGGLGNAGMILADANTFGRIYMSTAGRGIATGLSGTDTVFVDPGTGGGDPGTDPGTVTGSMDKERSFIQAYPNPFSHHITLFCMEKKQVAVYDLEGRRMGEFLLNKETSVGSEWPAGMYLLKYSDKRGNRQIKMIKY